MSKGQSQPTTHLGKRFLGKCKNKHDMESVEIIDVDNGKTDVYFICEPGSSRQGSRRYSRKSWNRCTASIIYIDEEVDDDNDFDNVCCSPKGKHAQPMDRQSHDAESHVLPHVDSKAPKINQIHAECSRNCYGFTKRTSYDSSESNSESDSDCEIVEDVSGSIRKQWEKAATRRKTPLSNQLRRADNCSSSPDFCTVPGFKSGGSIKGKVDAEYCMKKNYQSCSKQVEESTNECESSSHNENKFCSDIDDENIFVHLTGFDSKFFYFSNETELTPEECSGCDHVSVDSHCNQNDVTFSNIKLQEAHVSSESIDPPLSCNLGGIAAQTGSKNEGSYPGKLFEELEKGCLFANSAFPFKNTEKVPSEQPPGQSPVPQDSVIADEVAVEERANHFPEKNISNNQASEARIEVGKENFLSDKKVTTVGRSTCNSNGDEPIELSHSFNSEPISISLPHGTENHSIEAKFPLIQDSLIGDREKHKQSNEYRRAEEEEWAARHRELLIQAEEAQRQRRRRKAETLRLVDMERRQKQRLEEIRQSQKKDEEIINTKEQLRAEITKELQMIEAKFKDMASLLRGLGIDVKGGPIPSSHEINAAYKQALLKFHPDRASRTDIREQVEAEEKFKLISRLKEQLPPVALFRH